MGVFRMLLKTRENHETLRKQIRQWIKKEIQPNLHLLSKNKKFSIEQIKKLGRLGLMGLPYPKKYGGSGLDILSYVIALEELSTINGIISVILTSHVSLCSWPIFAFGTEKQKQKYLIPLSKGEKLGSFGLIEENTRSHISHIETTAILHGNHYILNGKKVFITNAPNADTYIVFAVTTPGVGSKGISAFIIEKDWEGITFTYNYDKLGMKSSLTSDLIFHNVKVPKENLLGKEGEGFKIAMESLDGGRIGIASQALGIAQSTYESSLSYCKKEVTDMASKLKTARSLIYSAAELKEDTKQYTIENKITKQWASDMALEIVNEILKIDDESGYLKGIDIEEFYKNNKITTIYEKTNKLKRVIITSNI